MKRSFLNNSLFCAAFMMILVAACKKDKHEKPEFISAQGPELPEFANENPWISWNFNANGGSITYDLYIGIVNPPDSLVADNITETSYQLRGLKYSTTYYFRVVAFNSDGTQVESPVMSFTTRNMPDFIDAFTGKYTGMLTQLMRNGQTLDSTIDFNYSATITRIDNNTLVFSFENMSILEGDYLEGSEIPNYFKTTDTTHFYFPEHDSVYCYRQAYPDRWYEYYGRKVSL